MSDFYRSLRSVPENWNAFWFAPNRSTSVFWTRVWLASVSVVVFSTYAIQARAWYGTGGWVEPALGKQLIGAGMPGTGGEFRLSPFYEHPEWMIAACLLGIAASVCLIGGRFCRIAGLTAFVLLLSLQARAPLFLERGEPLLLASLFYISLVPSLPIEKLRSGKTYSEVQAESWIANFGWRLVQVHFVIWIAFSLMSMLGYEGWWTGEAIRQLAEDRQGWIPASMAKLMFLESIAHGVILLQVGLLIAVFSRSVRFAGPLFLGGLLLAIMLVLGDWQYCLILAAAATSIWPIFSEPLLSTP